MIKVEIKGDKEFLERLANAPREVRKAAHEVVVETADMISETAKKLCPVRTGYLRSTIYSRSTGLMEAEVGAKASYAKHVEFGTSRMVARPFMRYAVQSVQKEFTPMFKKKVEEYLRNL